MKTGLSSASAGAALDRAADFLAQRYPLIAALLVRYRRGPLLAAAGCAAVLYTSIQAHALLTAENLQTVYGTVIGGDFIVFWTAAKAALSDAALALYQPETLNARLLEAFPRADAYKLTWQYPPTMYLVVAPLGLLPYTTAVWVWSGLTAALLAGVLRSFWRDGTALILAFTSAAAFQGLITGQTGFLTGALIAAAAGWADRRPLLAGLAAGLLTVKPQLGLLIPIAFAAAGCWRAFGAAALTGASLAALSVAAFGVESWVAFYEAASAHGGLMSTDVFPYHKLITVLGAATLIGAPTAAALATQAVFTLCLAAFVFVVWRRTDEWDLRAMALCAAAPLATPYAFYYELPALIPPLILLARRGMAEGWLRGERPALAILWFAPVMLPGARDSMMSFIIAFAVLALCARRIAETVPLRMNAPPRVPA